MDGIRAAEVVRMQLLRVECFGCWLAKQTRHATERNGTVSEYLQLKHLRPLLASQIERALLFVERNPVQNVHA